MHTQDIDRYIYSDDDYPDIVERISRKIRSIF